jgi:tetratricopeptide (TPR) repeat protein
MMGTNQLDYQGALPYEAGKVTGQALVYLLFLCLALKSFSIARRPNANAKCALSLGIFFSSMVMGGIISALGQAMGVVSLTHRIVAVLGGLMVFAGFIAALVLAITGLVEYSNHKGKYTQGRAQAIWTVSLSFPFLCLMAFGAYRGFQQARLNTQTMTANQPDAGQWLVFNDFNFKIRSPGKPWAQLDAKKINKNATVAFAQTQPQVFFMILAERVAMGPNMTTEAMVEIAKANLRGRMDSLQILKENPLRRQGLDGVQLDSAAQNQSYHLLYRNWICVTNGYVYQLVAWGNMEDATAVRAKSDELYAAFSLIDFQRQSPKSANEASDFHSDLFGYNVKLAGSGWRPSPLMAKSITTADFTSWDGYNNVGLFVIPLCLMDQDPRAEALAQAMTSVLGVAYPGPDIQDEKPITQGELSGVEFGFERPGADGKLIYRIKLLQGRQRAYLVGAYYLSQQKDDNKNLEEELQRVEFPVPTTPPPDPVSQFSERDKHRHGQVFNGLGLFYYNDRQFEKSAVYFQIAFQFERNSPVFLGNVANAYSNAGKRQEALSFLEDNPALLATNQSARAVQAYLQLQLEQVDNSLTNFGALFAEGYRNDGYFVEYVTLLNKARQQDVALAAVDNYLKQSDSAAVRLLQARLYKLKKNFTKAIELLKAQCAKYPYNTELKFALADAYAQAGLYGEAVATCQQLIDAQNDSAAVFYVKGSSEFGLKRYREAKASFEAALKKDPSSAEAKSYLDLVSGMLGEGSNSGLKEPIAAVPIPEKLFDTPPVEAPPAYTRDFGARYVKIITAISFVKNKEFKRTDFFAIKVLDSSGIAAFSTMQFGFDPLSEGIFVNDLKVKDEEGKVMATGKVDDYYVVDAASTTTVSQKKVLNIPISGLRPGSLIELMVTRNDLAPPNEFPFTAHTCLTLFPILEDILLVRGETNALKFAGLGAEDGTKSDDSLYWVRQQPEVYKWEPMEPSPADFEPALYVGDNMASWDGEAKKYLGQIGDYLQLGADGREIAAKLAGHANSESEKILSLARYVQTNYTYKALEFGRRARLPHKTAQIIHNHYGDCKDLSLLLQQMLEASGIPAQLALVKSQGKVRRELPSLDQFDHMVVFLPTFQSGFFLDCTDKGSDLAQATPFGLAGKEALILDATHPRFVTMPDYPDGSSSVHSRREVSITNGTDVVVHEVLSLKGCNASALRTYFKQLQPSARRNFVDLQLNRQAGEVSGFKLQNLEDTQVPLVLELDYIFKKQFHLTGNQLVGKLPDVWEQLYASAEPVEYRTTPFELSFPVNVESAITLAIPPGYREPALKDFRQNLQMAFANSQSEVQKEGTALKIDYRLHRRSGTFAAAEYGPYRENMVKALGPLEQTVAFTKSP